MFALMDLLDMLCFVDLIACCFVLRFWFGFCCRCLFLFFMFDVWMVCIVVVWYLLICWFLVELCGFEWWVVCFCCFGLNAGLGLICGLFCIYFGFCDCFDLGTCRLIWWFVMFSVTFWFLLCCAGRLLWFLVEFWFVFERFMVETVVFSMARCLCLTLFWSWLDYLCVFWDVL